jgi:hypothetical protein
MTFATEILFIRWLEAIFLFALQNSGKTLPTMDQRLLLSMDIQFMMPQVTALCGARKIILFKFVPHSYHIAQPLDLWVLGLFKMIYRKEKQRQGIKQEARKIHQALLTFYKTAIIPMVRRILSEL